MDVLERLEALRPVIGVYYSNDKDYGKDLGADEMLDNCLDIIWKWIKENHLEYLIT